MTRIGITFLDEDAETRFWGEVLGEEIPPGVRTSDVVDGLIVLNVDGIELGSIALEDFLDWLDYLPEEVVEIEGLE